MILYYSNLNDCLLTQPKTRVPPFTSRTLFCTGYLKNKIYCEEVEEVTLKHRFVTETPTQLESKCTKNDSGTLQPAFVIFVVPPPR